MSELRKHLYWAAAAGLALRAMFIWRFPAVTDDSLIYEELARNWLDHHVYGLFLGGQLTPVDLRVPGYPAFLAGVYLLFGRGRLGVLLVQALLDLATCGLTALLAARLVPAGRGRRRAAIAALWLGVSCPFIANYVAAPLTEVLATFLTALALVMLTAAIGQDSASLTEESGSGGGANVGGVWSWLAGGFCVGLGTLVRPETPLLLASTALVLATRWRRRSDWTKLVRAGALLAIGLFAPLVPWAARNWLTLHRVQFLAPRNAELAGEFIPKGFNAWTRTWLVRFRDVYLVPWKLETEPILVEDLPAAAFDSPEERARVATLFEEYSQTLALTPEQDRQFAQLARERTARHPLRTYLWVPVARAATIWFTPRIELLPYSGKLWPPRQQWDEDPVDFSVTCSFALLNFFYVGLALAGTWRLFRARKLSEPRRGWLPAVLVAFILVRMAFLTQVDVPEPRYVLECFPAVLAVAAVVWARRREEQRA